uniref:Uncharacterized protein n=1 Tax=Vespula pensylvanica TaxID=30213 RepID=A0A834P1C8_VESPE|nr:hypothetical protein H0235_009095 [Vespula pensylvanica]
MISCRIAMIKAIVEEEAFTKTFHRPSSVASQKDLTPLFILRITTVARENRFESPVLKSISREIWTRETSRSSSKQGRRQKSKADSSSDIGPSAGNYTKIPFDKIIRVECILCISDVPRLCQPSQYHADYNGKYY